MVKRNHNKISIYPGRFQPFHLGHLKAINYILKEEKELIIVIENATESFTLSNPFTAGERIEMIRNTLKVENIDLTRILLIPVSNIENNAQWVNYLKTMLPDFDICYSNNNLVKVLMQEAGVTVKEIPFLNRDIYQGNLIRARIIANEPWKELVPEQVYNIIMNKGLDKRIRRISEE
ncbi:MAG: nicotinamide-nucleotide adenylyltransferase [Thermoplasmata archaeon]